MKSQFISNGIKYVAEVSHDGDIVTISQHANNELVGEVELDHQVEQAYISYYNADEGHLEDFDTQMHLNQYKTDFPNVNTFGSWIAATHPNNQ